MLNQFQFMFSKIYERMIDIDEIATCTRKVIFIDPFYRLDKHETE